MLMGFVAKSRNSNRSLRFWFRLCTVQSCVEYLVDAWTLMDQRLERRR